jgi:hypothetical protein
MSATKLYVLNAHQDQELVDSFLALVKPRLKNVKNHNFVWWDPSSLLPGEERKSEINTHLADADYVILLLSPDFLAYLRDEDAPKISDSYAKLLPVMLVDVPLDRSMEFFGIDDRQIYCGDTTEQRSYVSLDSAYQRNRFVDGFIGRMIRRIDDKGGYQ